MPGCNERSAWLPSEFVDVERARRQLEPAEEREGARRTKGAEPASPGELHVAEPREVPSLLDAGQPAVLVDEIVHVLAMQDRDPQRNRPVLVDTVTKRGEEVAVAGVALERLLVGDLAGVDVGRAAAKLILRERLQAQVDAQAVVRLRDALRVTIGHQGTEGGAAGRMRGGGQAKQRKERRQAGDGHG